MKLFVTIFVVFFVATYTEAAKISCEAELKNADKCLGEVIVVGMPKIPMFRTVQDFEDEYCDKMKSRLKCAQGYKKCLKAFPRTIYAVAVNGLKKIGSICKTREAKEELIQHFSCFAALNSTQVLTRIGNRVTLALNHVLTKKPDEMISNLCCAYHTVMRQVVTTVDDTCESVNINQGKESGKYFVNLVGSALNDPVELICGAYASYEVCQEKIPDDVEAIENATKWELTKNFVSSPIIPVLNVVQQLDSEMNI